MGAVSPAPCAMLLWQRAPSGAPDKQQALQGLPLRATLQATLAASCCLQACRVGHYTGTLVACRRVC